MLSKMWWVLHKRSTSPAKHGKDGDTVLILSTAVRAPRWPCILINMLHHFSLIVEVESHRFSLQDFFHKMYCDD